MKKIWVTKNLHQHAPSKYELVCNVHLSFFFSFNLQIADCAELWAENSDQSSTLVIAEAKPLHTGRYTVLVKDRMSSAQHTLTLSVIGKGTYILK